jgi:hypothetical protein
MRSIISSAAVAATVLVGSYGSASAQVGFGIYVGPDYYDGPYYEYSPGYVVVAPRRRYYSDPDDVVIVPRRSGGCGTYRYWDGERCVDARYR